MTRIAMWSGPRNISTALMRSFENRFDTFVSDEPFYAHYLHKTGIYHPYRKKIIENGEINKNTIVDMITGDIPNGKKIWYQKHMAQHNIPGEDMKWIKKMRNILLIRDPKEVILSYIKKYKISSILQLGYIQQKKLYALLKEHGDTLPLIIDARDMLKDPEGMLKYLCRSLDIHFYEDMLTWPAGSRTTDGIWGRYWYGNVKKSTGFKKYYENNQIIPPEYKELMEECMKYYKQLYQHRMRIT